MQLLVTVPNELVSNLFTGGLESIIGKCGIEIYNEGGASVKAETAPEESTKAKPVVIEYGGRQTVYAKPHKDNNARRKLIKYRCPECGEYNFKIAEKGLDGTFFIPCRGCGEQHAFSDADLLKLEFTCNDCGHDAFYFTPVGDYTIDYDRCKECGAKKSVVVE